MFMLFELLRINKILLQMFKALLINLNVMRSIGQGGFFCIDKLFILIIISLLTAMNDLSTKGN